MASQSPDQIQNSAQSSAPIVHVPAQDISELSSLPVASLSEQASTDEFVPALVTHRGPGSLHSGRRRSSSTSSLSEPARRTKAEGVQGSASDIAASSPSDASFAQGQAIVEVAPEQGQTIVEVTPEQGQTIVQAEPGQGQTIVEVVQGQTVVAERPPPLPVPPSAAYTLVSAEQIDGRSTSAVTPPRIEVPLRLPQGRPR